MVEQEGVGYLTVEEFNRFGWAVHHSRTLISWLRVAGYIKSADADVERQHRRGHPSIEIVKRRKAGPWEPVEAAEGES